MGAGIRGPVDGRLRRELIPGPLVAHRIQQRGIGPVATAFSATGKRSLSTHLAQSVLSAPILTAWGSGLGAHLTSWTMFLFAVGVWALTVVAAFALERAGRRGPAEVLLRRLTHRSGSGRPRGESSSVPGRYSGQEHTTP